MSEQQKECQECGWRGAAEELDETDDPDIGRRQIYCPDCGGMNIKDLDRDNKADPPES